ncbi:muts domain V-domain-containing protein [Cyathus striatus]|nr:muts domain V-domain-containing protein [Cyathus striatus]
MSLQYLHTHGLCEDATPVKKTRRKKGQDPGKCQTSLPSDSSETEKKPKPRASRKLRKTEAEANLQRFPHCLLLTRVGQFYESYFDQAAEIAHLLNIKLTSRKWNGRRVPMCGFPLMHLDKYLKILVQQNQRFVAMCEEFPRYSSGGHKEFERRVVRIITPGTLIDEPFLNPYENNYLLAINASQEENSTVGLAWIDVSTGEFFSKTCNNESIQDELTRIGAREVIVSQDIKLNSSHPLSLALAEEGSFQAVAMLTRFLRIHLMEHMRDLSSPIREGDDGRMQIDSHTIRALEIRETVYEGGTKGSLMSVLKRTKTASGTRLLSRWLCSPSTSLSEISSRQSLVSCFHNLPHFRADLTAMMMDMVDIGRITQKLTLGRGDCNDLLVLNHTISLWDSLKRRVKEEIEMPENQQSSSSHRTSLERLMSRFEDLHTLSQKIGDALGHPDHLTLTSEELTEDPVSDSTKLYSEAQSDASSDVLPSAIGYNSTRWLIKPTFSEEINDLHTKLQQQLEGKENLEKALQLQYDAPSLTLRSSPAHGMHVHIAKSTRDEKKLNSDPSFVLISASATTKCYFYQNWSRLGNSISETVTTLAMAEKEVFGLLRNKVACFETQLRRNAQVIDELDVLLAFAELAADMNFVKPTVTTEPDFHVVNARHPAVELGLLGSGRTFTPNSVDMTTNTNFHIITGPNMAGKSTFLRQTALITILAQVGSFVPADSATVGIVDRLFCRIGARDDLFRDRSTFMVEMLETADILRRATPRSLVIMDEVGRGTTVKDGLAIAFATVHHLVAVNKCRALFATHFHELSDMFGYSEAVKSNELFNNIRFYCTNVEETDDGRFSYSYRLRPGINRDSHGLKVAQLAGFPPSAMETALHTLQKLS